MYESHFGLSGPPFQLNPDPSFYFDSRGHANALSYLKFGVFQGEGFIVVTGEVGAGKTTLVRTLLSMLNREQVVAAQVVSTQLEAGDLLRAIVAAFGIAPSGQSKAELILSLEGFLTALAAKKRRALLVVDEAQNLSLEAIEELRMLSNFQLGNHALLQSFLVGQPELRAMLQSPSMLQFRQRVIASCHLGPLDRAETRAYIEHRLRKAGWKEQPSFEDSAFKEIHDAAGGVPRRINLLCNRILLACYLSGQASINGELCKRVAQELRIEVGDPSPQATVGAARPFVVTQGGTVSPPVASDDAVAANEPIGQPMSRNHLRNILAGTSSPILFLADSPIGRLKAGAFSRAMLQYPKMPPVLVVGLVAADQAKQWDEQRAGLPTPPLEIRIPVPAGTFAATVADLMVKFDAIIDEAQPYALISAESSDATLACSLLACKRGVRQIRLDSGQRRGDAEAADGFNGALLDRLADMLMTNRLTAHYTLHREGIPSERVLNVGSLTADMLHHALPGAVDPSTTLARAGAPLEYLRHGQGFALATLSLAASGLDNEQAATAAAVLRAVSMELPLVWIIDDATRLRLKELRLDALLRQGQVALLPGLDYLAELGLLMQARLVVAGTERALLDEAVALDLPCLIMGTAAAAAEEAGSGFVGLDLNRTLRRVTEIIDAGPRHAEPESLPADETSKRIAEFLRVWLPKAKRAKESSRRGA